MGIIATTFHMEIFTFFFFIFSTILNEALGALVEALGALCVGG